MMLIKKVYLVATLLMLAGCSLEHSLIIDMKDRGYSVDYIQSRDLDLIPFLYPSDLDRWTVLDSSEIELHHQRTFSYDEAFPSLFTINSIDENNSMMNNDIYTKIKDKEIVLKEPYQITSSNLFILKNYQFEGTFKSRRIENNYDKLINYYSGFMDDAELIVNGNDAPEKEYNSINAIFNQLIGFLYIEVINNSSIEFNQKGIYLNALKEWSSKPEILALINEDKIGLDGEQLSKILGLAEEYLNEVIDDSYADEVKDIWEEFICFSSEFSTYARKTRSLPLFTVLVLYNATTGLYSALVTKKWWENRRQVSKKEHTLKFILYLYPDFKN